MPFPSFVQNLFVFEAGISKNNVRRVVRRNYDLIFFMRYAAIQWEVVSYPDLSFIPIICRKIVDRFFSGLDYSFGNK